MSNSMIPPVPFGGASQLKGTAADDENKLATNNSDLDEGETTDSPETVEQDVQEAAEASKRLQE